MYALAVVTVIFSELGPEPPVVIANMLQLYVVKGCNSGTVNVSTGLSCTCIASLPSSDVHERVYESIRSPPSGGSQENLIPKPSGMPVKFIGAP